MKAKGAPRKWIGVKMNSRAISRNGFDCLAGDPAAPVKIGYVTSGNYYCPTLGGSYALCMVAKDAVKVGDTVVAPSSCSGTSGNNFTPDPFEIYLRSNSTYSYAFGPGGVTFMFGILNSFSSKLFYILYHAKVGVTLL